MTRENEGGVVEGGLVEDGLVIAHRDTVKVVRKGWGEERWLVAETAPFGFKVIRLHAGQRTSLQYHARKEEANLILQGEALLHCARAAGEPTVTRRLVPGNIVHIQPGTVHRLEAISDLTLVEVSTPELDDVIRLSDDFGRGDGRIAAEHVTTAP
jgi:mannose-6-phosphate isomerase